MTSKSRMRPSVWISAAGLCLLSVVAARAAAASPERAVRDFIRALAMHDTQVFSQAIRPDPRASHFHQFTTTHIGRTSGGSATARDAASQSPR